MSVEKHPKSESKTTPEDLNRQSAELYQRIRDLGEAALIHLTESYNVSTFSYRDMVDFARQQGRTPQEAGKLFTRFYNNLKDQQLAPLPPDKYEHHRDTFGFPLYMLTAILRDMPVNEDDSYDKLLRRFHAQQLHDMLVN